MPMPLLPFEMPRWHRHGRGSHRVPILAVLATLVAAPAASQQQPVVDWLRARALPLATTEPDSGLADLEPLRALIGDARVVMLGEATHGSREFFQLKHRVLEFLAREMGFTILAREGNFAGNLRANDYVAGTTTDSLAALQALGGWVSNTEEHLSLLQWMRRFNTAAPQGRALKLYGFDMQDPWTSHGDVLAYLTEVDPTYADSIRGAVRPLSLPSYGSIRAYSQWPVDSLAPIGTAFAAILARLQLRQEAYAARTSRERWGNAVMHARMVAQSVEAWRDARGTSTGGQRQRFMAQNILAIRALEGPATRMVVSAANNHVAVGDGDFVGRRNMGAYVRDELGADVVSIGFAFNRGSFQARHSETNQVMEHTVGPAPEGSMSEMLARVGVPLFLVDLRGAPTSGPVAEWLRQPRPERYAIGAAFNPNPPRTPGGAIVMAENFHVLLYVDVTTRARPVALPRAP